MQDGIKGVVTVQEIEHLLAKLPGVISARVVVNDWGAVEEIHILSSESRNPKQVVRDVESSLAARWGLYVDHKKISVAQLTGAGGIPSPFRLKLANMEVATDTVQGRVRGSVLLVRGDQSSLEYRGEAEGPISRLGTNRILGQATVDALNKVVDPDNRVSLESVQVVEMGQRSVAVVVLILITPRGNEEVLVGAALVRVDVAESVVKAVLTAVNRRILKLVSKGRTVAGPTGEALDP